MMSERDGDKHAFSYMDGIPVKISEKYKPPRKIVLPVGFQNRFLQAPVPAEYDFQFEKDVLENLQQWRSTRSQEKEKRKQRMAEKDAERLKKLEAMERIEETMRELSTDDKCCGREQSTLSPDPELTTHASHHPAKPLSSLPSQSSVCTPVISEVNPILRPIPIKHQVVSTQINNNKPLSAFNLSDFEADTSSPFDNMELKTLNDLEELAQVLQPSAVSHVTGYYQNTISAEEQFGNMHRTMNANQSSCIDQSFHPSNSDNMLNDTKGGVNYPTHINGYSSNYDYNSIHNYHPQSVIPHVNPHSQGAAYSFMEREQVSQPSDLSFSYTLQNTQPQLQNYYSSSVWPSEGVYRPIVHGNPSFGVGNANVGTVLSSNVQTVQLPSSSFPDEEEKSHEERRGPHVSSMAQQLSNLMKSRSSRHQSKPSDESSSNNSPSVQSPDTISEQDPLQTLHAESKLLVQKIAEMGFPIARVARACQNLGTNDKKIVEFLLSLQSLLDAGYQEGRAEHALSLHKQDVNAAAKFLQAESQLLDLGFSRDRVSEALMKFNCDRDQALDFLIS